MVAFLFHSLPLPFSRSRSTLVLKRHFSPPYGCLMMHFFDWQATLEGSIHGRRRRFAASLDSHRTPSPLTLNLVVSPGESASKLCVDLHLDEPIELSHFEVTARWSSAPPPLSFLANGYQSWSVTRELQPGQRQERLSPLVNRLLSPLALDRYGEAFFRFPTQKGVVYGYSFGYFRFASRETVTFLGSLDEELGFTRIEVDWRKNALRLLKDVEGLRLDRPTTVLDLVIYQDEVPRCFQSWARSMIPVFSPRRPTIAGWTSWYRHYQNISEDILLKELQSFQRLGIPLDVFQIDDGYQSAVGDWHLLKPAFPRGMKFLADRIHEAGFLAGIWLAPFAAERLSHLARNHPEWLLKNHDGQPLLACSNWSGFYALDILNPHVQDHLSKVFTMVLEEWGFDLVKLDFLFACCLRPRNGMSRAQILALGLRFLREVCGEKLLLACGVPLVSAFGRCDFCRVGPDAEARWSRPLYERVLHPEIPSTRRCLTNALARLPLNGLGFINDPDVFLLRSHDTHLNSTQRHTMLYLTYLLGGVWMTSDSITEYGPTELALYRSGFPLQPKLVTVHPEGSLWLGTVECKGRHYVWAFNPSSRPHIWKLGPGWYAPSRPWLGDEDPQLELWEGPLEVTLRGFELKLVLEAHRCGDGLVGTVGGLLPGSEIDEVDLTSWHQDGHVRVRLHPRILVPVWAWVAPQGLDGPLLRVGPLNPPTPWA